MSRRDERARTRLFESYLGLVRHAAHRLLRRGSGGPDLDDLIGAGTLGLAQSIEGFDPERGLAFSTYAMPRIRGAMLDEINAREWSTRSVRMRRRQLARARAELQHRLGRIPDPEQVAERLGLDLATYWKWVGEIECRVLIPLDEPDRESRDSASHHGVPDLCGASPGDEIERAQMLRQLHTGLMRLAPKDRLVLSLSYYEGLTHREIGEVLHVSESRVSQLRGRALRRLREVVDL